MAVVRARWQRRRRRRGRQRRHRRDRAPPVRHGRRPVRARAHPGGRDRRPSTRTGRAGAGADPEALRAERHASMPMRHDVRTVTVPGCVDGWVALHGRFGTLDLADRAGAGDRPRRRRVPGQPAAGGVAVDARRGRPPGLRRAARAGDDAAAPGCAGPASRSRSPRSSPAGATPSTAAPSGKGCSPSAAACSPTPTSSGCRPTGSSRCARAPSASTSSRSDPTPRATSRSAPPRLVDARRPARRSRRRAPGRTCWPRRRPPRPTTVPPRCTSTPTAPALVAAIGERGDLLDPDRAQGRRLPTADGDTTYLCTADDAGFAVSLIQSNAVGLRLLAGRADDRHQPAQPRPRLQPRARATRPSSGPAAGRRTRCARRWPSATASWWPCSGRWAATPSPRSCCSWRPGCSGAGARRRRPSPRPGGPGGVRPPGSTRGPPAPRRRWRWRGTPRPAWRTGLLARGHDVAVAPEFDSGFGHAHVIAVEPTGAFAAAADPRRASAARPAGGAAASWRSPARGRWRPLSAGAGRPPR